MNSISTIRPFAIGHRITVTHSITTACAEFILFQRTLSAVTRWCSSRRIIIATAATSIIIACTTAATTSIIIIVCTTVSNIVIVIDRDITSSTG
jgi:hypothetical protein